MRTIDRANMKFIEEGLDTCLERCPTSLVFESKTDGDVEANLITLCFSEPPEGYAKWSLRLLVDKRVE